MIRRLWFTKCNFSQFWSHPFIFYRTVENSYCVESVSFVKPTLVLVLRMTNQIVAKNDVFADSDITWNVDLFFFFCRFWLTSFTHLNLIGIKSFMLGFWIHLLNPMKLRFILHSFLHLYFIFFYWLRSWNHRVGQFGLWNKWNFKLITKIQIQILNHVSLLCRSI
jgi:hypothetical protein